jgi:hypothetical protein
VLCVSDRTSQQSAQANDTSPAVLSLATADIFAYDLSRAGKNAVHSIMQAPFPPYPGVHVVPGATRNTSVSDKRLMW